jgi:hypothetical protein
MTIEQIRANGARFALNEITGQMLEMFADGKQDRTLIAGDTDSPKAMLSLLFDSGHIDTNWSPLPNCEARTRYERSLHPEDGGLLYRHSICGCIDCKRL